MSTGVSSSIKPDTGQKTLTPSSKKNLKNKSLNISGAFAFLNKVIAIT